MSARAARALVSHGFVLLATALAPSGCYLAHEREPAELLDDGGAPDRTEPPRDAGDARVTSDGGRPRSPDVGVLPVEPEPDGAVDVPPDAWFADAATPPQVTLTPVGEPVLVDDDMSPGAGGGVPILGWNGDGWGLLWSNMDLHLRALDQDGVPLTSSTLVQTNVWPGMGSLDFAAGRYAVVTASSTGAALRLFDRNTRLATSPASITASRSADVARLDGPHQWIVAARSLHDPSTLVFTTFDDGLRAVGDPVMLRLPFGAEAGDAVRIAAVKTRAVAIWSAPWGPQAVVLAGAPLAQVGEVIDLGGAGANVEAAIEIEPMGGRFVITTGAMGGSVHAFVLDPWSGLVEGPFAVDAHHLYEDARPAPVPEHGMFGVCWAYGRDARGVPIEPSNSIGLQVLAADGRTLGAPLVVTTGLRNAAGVACGWNGTELVVAWFRASGDNDIFTQRVRVAF